MKFKFFVAPEFKKEFKALYKKYKSLKKDFKNLQEEFKNNPNLGKSLGNGLRKIRLNITSKSEGKSGGARVISHELIFDVGTVEETKSVAFISIYDKSEYETVDLDIIKKTVVKHTPLKKKIKQANETSKKTPIFLCCGTIF